ncbi:PadR family transcriptional regulator [Bacillus cereus]|uniref:PadR family transcriptional regulator n=1 Tax=Bacillus cereus group TaxID=86661 RepID=UPI001D0F3297|nr:PadR family transcriptional regulator [Bacillus cereus]MCC2370460.1 PadR family transcriptional regulator [Bacillus cereus]MCC2450165.1 PadR family transcriptional regulator [Bacillus cereus]MCC2491183.1 PadR family transcriptional regulator [Bacillus cereus]MCU5627944.1 PadR family transcriptional regulator [Bacillus cereus]MDF9552226.1 PadR family transcriptional regulator [Bacillus cereus]
MGVNVEGAKFFLETPDGERVEIKGGVQEVSIDSDKVVDSGFDFGKEYSGTFACEEPQNIKELRAMGFTDQQAWNIHLRKGERWKQNYNPFNRK